MRLVHLSDLHLGKKLSEASLMEDQRHMLTQVLCIIDQQKPDCVLIAGDVYDKPVPPAEAVALLDDFLTNLAARALPVVLISGNHDSAERLAFGSRLFSARGVYVSPPFDATHTTVTPVRLQDAFGTIAIWPLPFIKPAHVRAAMPGAPADTYTQALRSVTAAMPLAPQERNVLVCHQFLTGSDRTESEEIAIGGLDNVDAAVFDAFDYVALGHLHKAQSVGRATVRYPGTLLKYSFSEAKDVKSLTVVDLLDKGDVRIQTVPISPLRDLRQLRGTYAQLTLRANYQDTAITDYLHITLTDETDIPDALSKLQSIYPNLLKLEYDNVRTRQGNIVGVPGEAERRSPMDLIGAFYQLQNNQPMNAAQSAYTQLLLQDIWEGQA